MNSRYFKFTNCGSTGRTGPTQEDLSKEYRGTSLENNVSSNNGIQIFRIPYDGVYEITAKGSGSPSTGQNSSYEEGAIVKGAFSLRRGERLKILVGQENHENGSSSGGAGGTFVVRAGNTPLLVAGGGSENTRGQLSTEWSNSGDAGYGGGSQGSGAGAGGGFLSSGIDNDQEGGQAFIDGGLGGSGSNQGGFGGGGSARSGCCRHGGGGGYAGGDSESSSGVGYGGTSFIHSSVFSESVMTSDGSWLTTGNEPHLVFEDENNVSSLGEWNEGHGEVLISLISIREKDSVFKKENSNTIYKYNNFINNLFFNKYKNDTKIKIALFDKKFKFNAKDRFLSDIDLSNEISVDNYKRKEIKDLEIKRKDNKLLISGNNIVWNNKNIKARYAVFYIDNNKEDLLFCIDFNRIVSSNSKGKFNLKWKDQKIFELSNLSNKDLNLKVIDWLEDGEYSFEEKNSLVKKELESIQNDKLLFSSLLNNNKFISLLLKSDNALSYINKERFVKYLISEKYSFKNSLGKVNKKSILDYIVGDIQLFSNLLEKTNFINFLLYNKDLIVKNCNKENLIYLLKNVIDFNKDKEILNDIYEKYKYLIDNNSDLNIVYKNKIQELDKDVI